MSKKQKKLNANLNEKEDLTKDQISQGIVKDTDSKQKDSKKDTKDKKVSDKKKDKKDKKNKKENKGGLVKKTKETMSELKKVTWPTFGEVVKKTGIVIAFVIIFGLFLFGVNTLLAYLVGLLIVWL